ncbi:XrtA/PEP-CTERM system exopolysaccharide export protein [Photobacterium nomapromontoriensis]|uniref:XrtA/PEP-CTERM system exopolysaccharide export protein n=1 Tax=Photobacterium nomapromontoriensis TaxID=2910237 RepID=UPI003D1251E9
MIKCGLVTSYYLVIGTLLAGSMSGCSSSNIFALPPATPHASLTKNINDYNYLIGPGDNLTVFVWGSAEITGSYIVRPDGMISTSLVEDIQASGRTPTDLARSIEAHLAEYIRDPIVTVMVADFVGPYSEQVRIIGEASQPKAINYRENMTLLDVMVEVGGLTEYADGNDARLIRVVNNQQKQYSLRMGDLVKDGDIRANVDILPGDIIIIPESWF